MPNFGKRNWGRGGSDVDEWGLPLYKGMKRRLCLEKSDSEMDCHTDGVNGTPSELNFHWKRNQCDSTHPLCMEECVSQLPATRWPAASLAQLWDENVYLGPQETSSRLDILKRKHRGESLEPALALGTTKNGAVFCLFLCLCHSPAKDLPAIYLHTWPQGVSPVTELCIIPIVSSKTWEHPFTDHSRICNVVGKLWKARNQEFCLFSLKMS